jgi:hypothetical protein
MQPFELRLIRILAFLLLAGCSTRAAVFTEDFSSDPAARGWLIFGDTNLFHWNGSNGNLEVTWDSSQTNSYFHIPLDASLATSDDFGFAFDLKLSSIAIGVNPSQPYTFELAVGFLGWQNATNTNLQRGSGINAAHGPRNLLEFDYFPDSGYGATVSPTMVSSNHQFAPGFDFPLEMDVGHLFHVAMNYAAASRTLSTSMTRDGQPFGPIHDVVLEVTFTDFRLDHFAISSYSEAGADGSLLAQGTVDNILLTTPAPPVQSVTGRFVNGNWQVQFNSRTNWVYTLERTLDFQTWDEAAGPAGGTSSVMVLEDRTPPVLTAFYRIKAQRQ